MQNSEYLEDARYSAEGHRAFIRGPQRLLSLLVFDLQVDSVLAARWNPLLFLLLLLLFHILLHLPLLAVSVGTAVRDAIDVGDHEFECGAQFAVRKAVDVVVVVVVVMMISIENAVQSTLLLSNVRPLFVVVARIGFERSSRE